MKAVGDDIEAGTAGAATRKRGGSVSAAVSSRWRKVDNHVKLFGMATLFTACLVVGMSIYVVHYKEVRFNAVGRNLVNDDGETLITENPSTSTSLYSVINQESEILKTLESVVFMADLPDGESEVIMRVGRIIRVGTGMMRIYGNDGATKITLNLANSTVPNTYTDVDLCPKGCKITSTMGGPAPAAASEQRRLLSSRDIEHANRKLWGWFKKKEAKATAATQKPVQSVPSLPSRDGTPFVCPLNCIQTTFTFGQPLLECSSCTPERSRWRCPFDGRNRYETAVKNVFKDGGFGTWSQSQCVRKKYSPSALAFAGPGKYDDYFVPPCPAASFCACGALGNKMDDMQNPANQDTVRNSWTKREQTNQYWASLAPGFTAATGFEQDGGGSWETMQLIYKHSDGRRQFCGMPKAFNTWPQKFNQPIPNDAVERPKGYKTSCGWWSGCWTGYKESSSSGDGCWFWRKKYRCVPEHGELEQKKNMPDEPITGQLP